MGVTIDFLRPRPDGSWEGDYTSAGRGTFDDFQDLLLSLPGCFLLPGWREDEYDMDTSGGTPPYPAWVSPELAQDLMKWLEYEAPSLLAALRQIPPEKIEAEGVRELKSLVERRLAEGYAILVSF